MDVEQRARELLAAEYRKAGANPAACELMAGRASWPNQMALNAIIAALTAQPSPGGQDALTRFRCAGYDASDEASEENTGGPIMVADPTGDWVRACDALAARQPVELIAQKVGDYRVTVDEDAITVSHGRDIVFAYSAGDPEPINARQPVGEPFAITDAMVQAAADAIISDGYPFEMGLEHARAALEAAFKASQSAKQGSERA